MDEAARQTSFSSSSSTTSSSSSSSTTTQRRPSSGSTSSGQHRRTGSVGAVSEQEAPSQRSSVNSACASASSMDSLDIDKVTAGKEAEGQSSPSTQGQNQTSTEVWLKKTFQIHTLSGYTRVRWHDETAVEKMRLFIAFSVWLMHVSRYSMFRETKNRSIIYTVYLHESSIHKWLSVVDWLVC